MGAILNGMSLTKVRPFGSGFFVFADYMRGSLRLSALMEIPVIYVFTHDSIGVGEDGPTHQPVEQLAHMRSTPGLIVIRPADANEVREAWKVILRSRYEPVALVLTRQSVPTIDRSAYAPASGLARGAYVLADAPGADPEVILIGTGSEVSLCLEAYEQLATEGVRARVVSLPSWELFDRQDSDYRKSVLPPRVKARVCVEQASSFGWSRHAGTDGHIIGIDTFGASAPFQPLSRMFGFSADHIVAAAKAQIARNGAWSWRRCV
jgi:transketolase